MNLTTATVARATFMSEGRPDTEVRVLPEMDGGYSFSICFNDDSSKTITVHQVDAANTLPLAESLQFVADTVSQSIPGRLTPFVRGWINTAADIHHTACQKGWWQDGVERNNGELLCLVHSEISEALEALREGNPPDSKLPEFTGVEVELADAVIRIMDLAQARGWRVAQAIEAKIRFNTTREYKHGKEF